MLGPPRPYVTLSPCLPIAVPRNPDKQRCATPTCRAWAMRGRAHCRSHLDHELGPRRAGAPKGNTNALKSGRYADPIPAAQVDELATLLLLNPDRFAHYIAKAATAIHDRSDNVLKSTILFGQFLSKLEARMCNITYDVELQDALQRLPPDRRPAFEQVLARHTRRFSAQHRLLYLRAMVAKVFEITIDGKTITGIKSENEPIPR